MSFKAEDKVKISGKATIWAQEGTVIGEALYFPDHYLISVVITNQPLAIHIKDLELIVKHRFKVGDRVYSSYHPEYSGKVLAVPGSPHLGAGDCRWCEDQYLISDGPFNSGENWENWVAREESLTPEPDTIGLGLGLGDKVWGMNCRGEVNLRLSGTVVALDDGVAMILRDKKVLFSSSADGNDTHFMRRLDCLKRA